MKIYSNLVISFFNPRKLYFLLPLLLVVSSCSNNGTRDLASSKSNVEDTSNWPKSFGIGRTATGQEIAAIDVDITPDDNGLPPGSGNVTSGRDVYQIKCASCHGINGTEGPAASLVGVMGDTTKAKTIGNYWPYSTTLFDYIRRAMPYNMPGSLTDNEVYSLTAYLLFLNKIIDTATAMNAVSLPKVKMPAQKLFVNDDRRGGPEVR